MSTRTRLLRASTRIVLAFVAACSAGDGEFEETRATDPTVPCDGAGAESSIADGHTHDLCVPASDLVSPPPNGAGYQTTSSDGHTHLVFLDARELAAMESGLIVNAGTSTTNHHSHRYALVRSKKIAPLP